MEGEGEEGKFLVSWERRHPACMPSRLASSFKVTPSEGMQAGCLRSQETRNFPFSPPLPSPRVQNLNVPRPV
jgi:hypothetical protein